MRNKTAQEKPCTDTTDSSHNSLETAVAYEGGLKKRSSNELQNGKLQDEVQWETANKQAKTKSRITVQIPMSQIKKHECVYGCELKKKTETQFTVS